MATPPPNNTKFSQEDLNNAQLFNEIFKDSNKEVNELFSGLHSISDEIKGQVHGYQLANKTVNSLTGIMGKIKDIQDNITTANSKDLKTLQKKAQSERKNLEKAQELLQSKAISEGLSDKEVATLANINGLLDEEDGLYKSINSQLGEIVNSSESVEKTMGNLGALAEGFSKGLQKAGLGALDTRLGISKALQDTKDMVAAGKGNVNNLQASQHFVKQLTNNLFKSLDATTLLSIGIKELYAALSKADKET
jgi:type I site-specific restriction endonuclease